MRKKQEAKHANKKIWKRRLLAGLIACGIFVTTGCGQVIDLTDEENHLIAEYAAELLLKYDRNYDTRYNPDELEDTTETMTETDATTEATTLLSRKHECLQLQSRMHLRMVRRRRHSR